MMQLFVGNNVTLGSAPMKAFVLGMHNAWLVSFALVLVAAGISFVRGQEDRGALAEDSERAISSPAD